MSLLRQGLTPRLRPLSSCKSATLSVLDIGTSKIVCLVAQLQPAGTPEALRGRTHLARVIGIGHQRSLGLKGGAVVDLEAAEGAIRQAIHSAERMAKVEIQSVIVNLTGGRLGSQHFNAAVGVRGGPVTPSDLHRVLEAASAHSLRPGRAVLHAMPTGFSLDAQAHILDPSGMMGEKLGVDLHVVTAEAAAARNLMLAVERCHLGVEAVIATPYAAGLSSLADEEAEMGCVVVDLGGGTTSVGVFAKSNLVHVDGFAVGGHHVTMDIARGLTTRVADAERLKTLYGSAIATDSDERDIVAVPQVDEDERDVPNHLPKSHLVRIIKPRVEEILELVRDRLKNAGFAAHAGRRVVLTGGASQLVGLPELARRILQGQIRIGRPLGIKGLPEAAKGPAFSAAVGLLVYPQVAHIEHFEPRAGGLFAGTGTDGGYLSKVGRWIRESF
ncbi:MAG TPA: cell division protein FtsA [Beijerinckiaceae bacterium]|nr:cell division protein FtsA [Beijerinckiaceae bacterium]